MELKVPPHFKDQVERTRAIVAEIRILKKKEDLTEADLGRLLELREELAELTPPARYAWLDGKPVVDIILGYVENINVDPEPTGGEIFTPEETL